MGRPPKDLRVLTGHRTKAELETREKAEKALRTGRNMKKWPAVKANRFASARFNDIVKAFEAIDLNDVLFESTINRYCVILGECDDLEGDVRRAKADLEKLCDARYEMDPVEYAEEYKRLMRVIVNAERMLAPRRNALLAIEKENIMTVVSKMRAVPKKPMEEEEQDPMSAVLMHNVR